MTVFLLLFFCIFVDGILSNLYRIKFEQIMLDVILIFIGALCMIAGLAGCILPFLPGPPIAYLGLFILHCTDKVGTVLRN
ncbi:hypothetical protein BFINE_43550 [Bacteroides finegoldii DSM 17565]|nr:hypothetical protein BFINE_43550 [Bacteroides finegoldii DSM 17565]